MVERGYLQVLKDVDRVACGNARFVVAHHARYSERASKGLVDVLTLAGKRRRNHQGRVVGGVLHCRAREIELVGRVLCRGDTHRLALGKGGLEVSLCC